MLSHLDEIGVWPIQIRILDKTGLTLWTDNDEHDLLLAAANNLLLFKKLSSLEQFVKRGRSCNISHLPGFQQLQNMLMTGHLQPDTLYDFNSIKSLFQKEDWSEWGLTDCTTILDSLNLLYDYSVTADDQLTLSLLTGESGSEISQLMNELTFIEQDSRHLLTRFDRQNVAELYDKILFAVDRATLYIC
jgi:hypothetical protein